MPLLFTVTLFLSASLLFMVQPMVGKMVLPLLGGSPAVWNACMVFFQALLLLGYLYAHYVSTRFAPKRQWALHLIVLVLPLSVMAIAATSVGRHLPIPIVEAFASGNESSPVLSVLALLFVAIGIPFFVASTSAPLLQKWFTYTGHPAARDPYFLYAASNFGSLISLLGYPLFIEPALPVGNQTWVWAVGFAVLAVLIFVCGRAAANPAVVPPAGVLNGNGEPADAPAYDPPPTWPRRLKWVCLAFVPSSLLLGVTFYISTDVASLPLIWVLPLALYLATFIVAFERDSLLILAIALGFVVLGMVSTVLMVVAVVAAVPFAPKLLAKKTAEPDPKKAASREQTFRMVVGNGGPVMLLLLIFSILAGVPSFERDAGKTMFYQVLIHLAAFFSIALMCHYELARDRPKPAYLTEFFLWISVGGVLGGIFNSLIAPLIFRQAYEYKVVLALAAFLIPKLTTPDEEAAAAGERDRLTPGQYLGYFAAGVLSNVVAVILVPLIEALGKPRGDGRPAASPFFARLRGQLSGARAAAVLDGAVPVVVGAGFLLLTWAQTLPVVDEAFEKVAKTLTLSAKTIGLVTIFAIPVMVCFFFVDRPFRFGLCVAAIVGLGTYRTRDKSIVHVERSFFGVLKIEKDAAFFRGPRMPDGTRLPFGGYETRRLVHGTTLHGTQIINLDKNVYDYFQIVGGLTPWEPLAMSGALLSYDARQEPLTYYHRTGPVGAMFHELRSRKNGADAKADVAMVGLGTGSVSCYALKDQKLDFYEIDHHVKALVADTDQYFTYVADARKRGAHLDFIMGDARLKLKDQADKRYALLLVDAFSSDAIPVHLLTREAVELYFNRMTEDGILALHISNKYVRLEPVVKAIADDLGLASRVWSDDSEGYHGKTASSWCVLAKKEQYLGVLGADQPTQVTAFGVKNPTFVQLLRKYGPDRPAKEALLTEYGDDVQEFWDKTRKVMDEIRKLELQDQRGGASEKLMVKKGLETDREEIQRAFARKHGAQAADLAEYVRKADGPTTLTMREVSLAVYGSQLYHPLTKIDGVTVWTDDFADVAQVLTIKELQDLRKLLRQSAPLADKDRE